MVKIPHALGSHAHRRLLVMYLASDVLPWLPTFFWQEALGRGFFEVALGFVLVPMLIAFCHDFSKAILQVQLTIDSDYVQIKKQSFGETSKTTRLSRNLVKEMKQRSVISSITSTSFPLFQRKNPCVLETSTTTYRFGHFLTEPEKAWLVAQINDFIKKTKKQFE